MIDYKKNIFVTYPSSWKLETYKNEKYRENYNWERHQLKSRLIGLVNKQIAQRFQWFTNFLMVECIRQLDVC